MTDLPLEWNNRYTHRHFCVGNSNQDAYHWINCMQWPFAHLWIYGPAQCGKTHMGTLWANRTNATIVVPPAWPETVAGSYVWVDWQDNTDLGCENRFFSFLQWCHSHQVRTLWTGRCVPSALNSRIVDVASRLRSMTAIPVTAPDDTLLERVLTKKLHDIGWVLSPKKMTFLVTRMPRSFSGIGHIVTAIGNAPSADGLSFHDLAAIIDASPQQ